ncbi:MAG: DUF4924 family protein [Marinifilaceae bacterium]|jgi:hypothetical protein|nr:DUF4924 family protein [Marinifilaceae bacterium]
MIIAQEKKNTNLAEYILYMWQVEDIIRACSLDIEKIKQAIINQYKLEGEKYDEVVYWYENLIEMMNIENIKEKGHLQIIKNNVNELYDYHLHLINEEKDVIYTSAFQEVADLIAEFRMKMSSPVESNDVDVCLTALYGFLILRLKKKEISSETEQAMKSFSKLLSMLTAKYKEFNTKDQK